MSVKVFRIGIIAMVIVAAAQVDLALVDLLEGYFEDIQNKSFR
jgi:Flp pilus assembly pilin Flp